MSGINEIDLDYTPGVAFPTDPVAEKADPDSLVARTDRVAKTFFPNVAHNIVLAAVARENIGAHKLRSLSQKVNQNLTHIDSLLDLNGELLSLPDKDTHELTPKMREAIDKLKQHDLLTWKGDNKISKEQLAQLKAQISSQIDKLRTSLQTTITTEIQPETTNLQAIMNIVQQMIQLDARLKRKTTELPH